MPFVRFPTKRAHRVLLTAIAIAAFPAMPASSGAEEVPQIISFTASPGTVKVGSSTTVSAAIAPLNSAYHVAIVNTDTGASVGRCAGWYSPCSHKMTIPWSENRNPSDLHLAAEVVPSSSPATGGGTPLTIDVERFEWGISLSASKNPLRVGEKTTLRVEGLAPDPRYTGYYTKIVNDDTGQTITACAGSECAGVFAAAYSMQAEAGPVHVHAEVVTEEAPYDVAGRSDLTLYVDPIPFRVSMSFSEPETSSAGERTWLASATPSPSLYDTPFTTGIHRLDGSSVAGCVLWMTSCARRLGPGTYRAVIKDGENIYAATQWWTIPPGSSAEPEEEAADDVNLLALAAMFAGPSQVCSALLFYPGTHLRGSSLSDQYLACEEAAAAGKSITAVLRAVAAAGGGTAVLWYLYEEKTKEQTPPEQTEPEEAGPRPVPPIGWPSEIEADAAILRELNSQLESDREARIVVKQCQRLTIRAALPTSRCTELPIFASGDLDVPQATKHDLEALLHYPAWVMLNYKPPNEADRGWYNAFSVCDESPRIRNCDEFPFFSTEQGGGSAKPRPSLKLIDSKQNKRQGGKLAHFYNACGVNIGQGKPFLNVPMPPGSNVPTLILCNGNS
ncbi:MAG: NucA/NucB deoxyribonuclease domain-containing protein [Actinomycetota bacterium]|nr:NucA/NucB deoxyribonuclease domain-containing protein [Actinomycetota bacterium]